MTNRDWRISRLSGLIIASILFSGLAFPEAFGKDWFHSPPVFYKRLKLVDPPRERHASQWNGLFCGAWTDSCTQCTRVGNSRRCNEATSAECKPDPVRCTKYRRDIPIERWCAGFQSRSTRKFDDGSSTVALVQSSVRWSLDKNHRWSAILATGNIYPSFNLKKDYDQSHLEEDKSCLETYAR